MSQYVLYRETAIMADVPEHGSALELYLKVGQRAAVERCGRSDPSGCAVVVKQSGKAGVDDERTEHYKLRSGMKLTTRTSPRGKPTVAVWLDAGQWQRLRRLALAQKLADNRITQQQHDDALENAIALRGVEVQTDG